MCIVLYSIVVYCRAVSCNVKECSSPIAGRTRTRAWVSPLSPLPWAWHYTVSQHSQSTLRTDCVSLTASQPTNCQLTACITTLPPEITFKTKPRSLVPWLVCAKHDGRSGLTFNFHAFFYLPPVVYCKYCKLSSSILHLFSLNIYILYLTSHSWLAVILAIILICLSLLRVYVKVDSIEI